jgi:small-conductance mechanosensitive channel
VVSDAPLTGLRVDPGTVLGAVAVLVVAFLAAKGVRLLLSALADRSTTRGPALRMAIPFSKFVVYAGAIYFVVWPLFRVSRTQALAFSGVLGAALGFGLKDLFANLIGGLVVTLETPYQVGDRVEIDDHYGEVVDVGVRATRLRTPDDDLVSVPNYRAVTTPVANATAGDPEMLVVTEAFVAPEADADRARTILEDAVLTSRYLDPRRPVAVRVADEPGYRTVRAKAYVRDAADEFAFESSVTRRALRRFDEEGVPVPRRPGPDAL